MYKKLLSITILSLLVLSFGQNANAQLDKAFGKDFLGKVAGKKGAGYSEDNTPDSFIAKGIQITLSFLGVAFLVLTIYGGFTWMIARGNEQDVEKAKNILQAAIIGLVIVLFSYAISYFVLSKFGTGVLRTTSS